MLVVRSFLVTALLLSAVQSAAKELAYYDALRLVSAMREDEVALRLARADKLERGKLNQQDRECLDSLEYPELTEIVARQIGYNMTPAEVQDALGYFQTASGRKYVQRELGTLGEGQFTSTDRVELEKFKLRPAGRKLFGDFILKTAAVTEAVAERVNRGLEDCAYVRKNDVEREIPEKSCQARPVASSDNVCLATYTAEGSARKPRRASVEVNCRQDGRVLTSRVALPKPETPIALRWSTDRDLQILVDGKVKNAPSSAGSVAKVTFASWQDNDPPLLTCEMQARGRATLANSLPASATVGAWRAYGRPGLCLMTSRVPKEQMTGADGDVLLQFRRQKPAVAPFAAAELALIVAINQQSEKPLLVSFGAKRLDLIAHPPQQTHMLTDMAAATVLDGLRSRPVELTVRSEGGRGYVVPLRGQDFDFAYAEFSECLRNLAAM